MVIQNSNKNFSSILLILSLLTAMGSLSTDMYLPALPDITKDLATQSALAKLTLTVFFLGFSFGQLIYGPLSDRFGRKKPLFFGLVLYFFSSLGCAFSGTIYSLIALRFLQSLGGCSAVVVARAIVRDLFDRNESARAFSFLMLVMGVSPILAPLIGGYLNAFFAWRSIFVCLSVLAVIALMISYFYLPETKVPDLDVSFKKNLSNYLFILKDHKFLYFALCGGFARAGMFAYITCSSFVFIELLKIPSENFGYIFGANALGMMIVAFTNRQLLKFYDLEKILRVGLFNVFLAANLLLVLNWFHVSFITIVIPLFFYISNLGITTPNSTAESMSGQGEHAGSASALYGGIHLGLASIVSIIASYFDNGTAYPMLVIMACAGSLSFLFYILIVLKRKSDLISECS